jgi:hypothetical protein
MTSLKLIGLYFLAVIFVGILAFAFGGFSTTESGLRIKFNEIQEEMTEQEVDLILLDYPHGGRGSETCELNSDGKPLKRKGIFSKMYTDKKDAIEGDYAIIIYLDENGLVVRKRFAALIK